MCICVVQWHCYKLQSASDILDYAVKILESVNKFLNRILIDYQSKGPENSHKQTELWNNISKQPEIKPSTLPLPHTP